MIDGLERAQVLASATATTLWKLIITVSLLAAGFIAFPEHKILFALCVSFIRHGLSEVSFSTAESIYRMNEIVVREAYQASLIHNGKKPRELDYYDELHDTFDNFRHEVRRRVETENNMSYLHRMGQDSPVSKLQLTGLLTKRFAMIIIFEAIYISIAFAISSQY